MKAIILALLFALPFALSGPASAQQLYTGSTAFLGDAYFVQNTVCCGYHSAIRGATANAGGIGVRGSSTLNWGVYGDTTNGRGVFGLASGSGGVGVRGEGVVAGVEGYSTTGPGIYGSTGASASAGVHGDASNGTSGYGVKATGDNNALYASSSAYSGGNTSIYAYSPNDAKGVWVVSNRGTAVYARSQQWNAMEAYASVSGVSGIYAVNDANGGFGAYGRSRGTGVGVFGDNFDPSGFAGFFSGNVHVTGTMSAAAKNFRIDHPSDPANKVLQHSVVESPDYKTIYDGIVLLDGTGRANVAQPAYFQDLNKEFRYQLTCIGGHAPVFIESEISNNAFVIGGGSQGLKVSWQVTGVRKDAWALQTSVDG